MTAFHKPSGFGVAIMAGLGLLIVLVFLGGWAFGE